MQLPCRGHRSQFHSKGLDIRTAFSRPIDSVDTAAQGIFGIRRLKLVDAFVLSMMGSRCYRKESMRYEVRGDLDRRRLYHPCYRLIPDIEWLLYPRKPLSKVLMLKDTSPGRFATGSKNGNRSVEITRLALDRTATTKPPLLPKNTTTFSRTLANIQPI